MTSSPISQMKGDSHRENNLQDGMVVCGALSVSVMFAQDDAPVDAEGCKDSG